MRSFYKYNELYSMNEDEIQSIVEALVENNYNSVHLTDSECEEICGSVSDFRLFQEYFETKNDELGYNTFNQIIEKCVYMIALSHINDVIDNLVTSLRFMKLETIEEILPLPTDIVIKIIESL